MKRRWWIGILAVVGVFAAGCTYLIWKSAQFPDTLGFLEKYHPSVEPTGGKYYSYDTIDSTSIRLFFREPYDQIHAEIKRALVSKQGWLVDTEWPELPSVSYVPTKGATVEVNIQPVMQNHDGSPDYRCIVVLSRENNGLQRWWFKYRYDRGWIK